ncbi:hypothetical protein [Mesorhizobium kowhaii]|uniref:Uncharacterized protein n=1 Tax=Mesorhizobium kowhaii TaxID=1300272 RepID=A0A2W7BUS9_9HYPH|nr:hypothetical protein [Mesorhizobium kowhaii]PZV34344.1 hypothetical protein B5V02_32885 [Mesorhizobium kowhaii]
MKRTKLIIALALLLAAQTAAEADSRIAKLCGSDHVNEAASRDDVRPNPGGYYVASLKSMDDRAMFTAIAVTIHLTNQGKLIRLPHVKPMTSMAECRAWTHQQEFMPALPDYLATFHYCDYASVANVRSGQRPVRQMAGETSAR